MIKFKKILEKLALGNMLEENEIKYIKSYLGYKLGINHLIGLLALVLFSVIFFILALNSYLIYAIISLAIGVIILLYYVPVVSKPFKKHYDEALEGYLKCTLGNTNFIYTTYLTQSGFPINKNLVYFIYDDYYFKLQEDLLKIERPKKNVIFKYPDLDCSSNNSISFKLQDIIRFEGKDANLEANKNDYTDLVALVPSFSTDFRLDLNDFKSISLGNNVYPYFKNLIKEKEK